MRMEVSRMKLEKLVMLPETAATVAASKLMRQRAGNACGLRILGLLPMLPLTANMIFIYKEEYIDIYRSRGQLRQLGNKAAA